jgi:hypothetical protein
MNYANKLGAFENSVEESKSSRDNFTARKDNITGENKKLMANAKSLQSSQVIQNVISGMSFEGGIRILRPRATKAMSWVDKKLGGKISKDTEGLKDEVTKVGKQLLKKGKGVVEEGVEKGKGLLEKGVKKGKGLLEDGVKKGKGLLEEGVKKIKAKAGMADDAEGAEGEEDTFEQVSDGVQRSTRVARPEEPMEQEMKEGKFEESEGKGDDGDGGDGGEADFGQGEEEDIADQAKFEADTKQVISENKEAEANGETNGEGGEGEGGEGEDVADIGKAGGGDVADEATGGVLETLGGILDATGIGALIGIPLQIAGAGVEIAGAVSAGESVGNWFNEDVLGNKPALKNVPQIKLPNAPSTLTSQGFLATPSFSSAVETSGAGGGW